VIAFGQIATGGPFKKVVGIIGIIIFGLGLYGMWSRYSNSNNKAKKISYDIPKGADAETTKTIVQCKSCSINLGLKDVDLRWREAVLKECTPIAEVCSQYDYKW